MVRQRMICGLRPRQGNGTVWCLLPRGHEGLHQMTDGTGGDFMFRLTSGRGQRVDVPLACDLTTAIKIRDDIDGVQVVPPAPAPRCVVCEETLVGTRRMFCQSCQQSFDEDASSEGTVMEAIIWAAKRARDAAVRTRRRR